MDSEGTSLMMAMRSGGFSLATAIVLLVVSRFMMDWAPALGESFQVLYGLLLLICIFWLFLVLFLTVKYSWVRRKNSFDASRLTAPPPGVRPRFPSCPAFPVPAIVLYE